MSGISSPEYTRHRPPFVGGRAYHLPTSRLRARVEVDNVQNLIPALCGVDNGTVRALGRVVKGDDHVMSVADTGGVINILLADTTHDGSDFVRSMTSDATTLYWVDLNRVRSMAKAGGAVADLAGPRTIPPWSLTRQGSDLYWIEATCCAHRDKGTIYTVPTTGGAPNQGTPLEGTPPLTPRKFSAPPPRTPSTARHSAPAATRSLARPHGSAIPGLFAR